MKRALCCLVVMWTVGCSKSPTAPTPTTNQPPTAAGPAVINLQWNVIAPSCAPVTMPPVQPAFANATTIRESDTRITVGWPIQSNGRPVTLVAHFILENNTWGLCSWDIADV